MATTSRDSVSATAPAWQQRFRASSILLSTIAIDAPDVGLVSSNASGIPQLYRWDTASGALTQLTFDEGGRIVGRLSPDGRWVTWLADTSGNEIGHWVVIPSDGSGDAIDLSPKLAPYASEQIAFSRHGGRVGFITASDDRLAVRVAVIGDDGRVGELQTVHHSAADLTALALSADGAIAAFSSAHRSKGVEHSILTADTARGEPGPELWDGPGTEHPGATRSLRGATIAASPRRPTRRAASGRSSGTWRRASAATCRRMPRRRHRRPRLVARRPGDPALPDRPGRAPAPGLEPRVGCAPGPRPPARRRHGLFCA